MHAGMRTNALTGLAFEAELLENSGTPVLCSSGLAPLRGVHKALGAILSTHARAHTHASAHTHTQIPNKKKKKKKNSSACPPVLLPLGNFHKALCPTPKSLLQGCLFSETFSYGLVPYRSLPFTPTSVRCLMFCYF